MEISKDKNIIISAGTFKIDEISVLWTLNAKTSRVISHLIIYFSFFFSVICEQCNSYVRLVFTLAPGISAVIALVIVGLCFKSKIALSCRPRSKVLVVCAHIYFD